MTNYYVYYKVDRADLEAIRARVQKLFRAMQTLGVKGRWMHRRDDASTYMEVYEDVKDDATFETLLASLSTDFPVPRRVEIFRMENYG